MKEVNIDSLPEVEQQYRIKRYGIIREKKQKKKRQLRRDDKEIKTKIKKRSNKEEDKKHGRREFKNRTLYWVVPQTGTMWIGVNIQKDHCW